LALKLAVQLLRHFAKLHFQVTPTDVV